MINGRSVPGRVGYTFTFWEQLSAEGILLGKKQETTKESEWTFQGGPGLLVHVLKTAVGTSPFAWPACISLSFRTPILLWGPTHLALPTVWSVKKLADRSFTSWPRGEYLTQMRPIRSSNRPTQRPNRAQVLSSTLKKLLVPKPWLLPRGKSPVIFWLLLVPAPILPWPWFFCFTLSFIHYPVSFL